MSCGRNTNVRTSAFWFAGNADQLKTKSNVVVLDPGIAELFPNAASVNAALRSLAEVAQRAGSSRRRSHWNWRSADVGSLGSPGHR